MISFEYIQLYKAPKIDLHMHLQGAANFHVAQYLYKKNKLDILNRISNDRYLSEQLELNVKDIEYSLFKNKHNKSSIFQYSSIQQFFLMYRIMCLLITDADDFDLFVKGVIIRLKAQNIVHADIIVSFPELLEQGLSIKDILGVLGKYKQIQGLNINWFVDLVRHQGPNNAYALLLDIIEVDTHHIIRGINLGGDECSFALYEFGETFLLAIKYGLKINIHDGEISTVENQKTYIKYSINRIAHGLNYIESDECREKYIEVCLSSNLKTNVIGEIVDHPIFRTIKKLQNICICTDDPTLFETDLARELLYILIYYGKSAVITVVENAAKAAEYEKTEEMLKWYENNISSYICM